MATAVFGRKKHMTQAFLDDGTLVGVTVIEVEPNVITAVRTAENDGYDAVQVGFGAVRSSRCSESTVRGVGCWMSMRRLCVRSWKCSRESLSLKGPRITV